MNKIAFIALLALFLLPSALACAGGDSQLIMRISSPSNAHAELWDGAGVYPIEICYDDPAIFNQAYLGAIPHAGNTVLNASAATNAHVEQATLSNYSTLIQYGDLVCTYGAACAANEVCIATISAATNAHIATCLGSPYPIQVCCSSLEALNAGPVANADGPHVLILPDNDITLDGSLSTDAEDCPPPGGTSCSDLTYDWAIVNTSGDPNCSLPASLVQSPITCTAVGTADVTLTVTDSGGLQDTDATTITVSAPGTGVCGVDISPTEVELDLEVVDVTVNYAGFDSMPPDYLSINCGSPGVPIAGFNCIGGASGTCTFTCGPYNELGEMGPVTVSLPNNGDNVFCGVPGARVFVFGTKIFALPIPLPRGDTFSMARAEVAVSSLTDHQIYIEAEIPAVGVLTTTVTQPVLAGTVVSFNLIAGGSLGEETLDLGNYVINAETFEVAVGSKGTVTKPFNVVVSAGQGVLKITKLFADPLALTSVSPDFTALDITVLNSGAAAVNSEIKLMVFDAVTGLPLAIPIEITEAPQVIASAGTGVWNSESLDVSSLLSGSYQLVVEAYEVGRIDPSDTESVFFTVGQPAAVPELGIVFIPLLAFSALGILFFSGRRKS